jgi:SpoVK/Ycf46/Vps4 family AAA+-type ATPase
LFFLVSEWINGPGWAGFRVVRPSLRGCPWIKIGGKMATAEQLKALLKSYAEGDNDRFLTVFMQVAGQAARKGQGKLASELRELIDNAKERAAASTGGRAVPIARLAGDLGDLVMASYPKTRLADMVLAAATRGRLQRVLEQYRQQAKLRSHGLSARRKLMLVGPPGSGKTMTAAALAGELHLPLLSVRLDGLITKFMGETAAKLRQIFDAMTRTRGVYLFDEFDAIGGDRARPNDVGEMRRVLNSFLHFLEADDSDSLILAATNHEEILDPALFRRFDDVIRYDRPTALEAVELLRNHLNLFVLGSVNWEEVRRTADGLSCAEIARASAEAAKGVILAGEKQITTVALVNALQERRQISIRNQSGQR